MTSKEISTEVHPLKVIRQELGLSQGGFADLLGVRPNTVGRWERGEREPELSLEQMFTLDEALERLGRRLSDYAVRKNKQDA